MTNNSCTYEETRLYEEFNFSTAPMRILNLGNMPDSDPHDFCYYLFLSCNIFMKVSWEISLVVIPDLSSLVLMVTKQTELHIYSICSTVPVLNRYIDPVPKL